MDTLQRRLRVLQHDLLLINFNSFVFIIFLYFDIIMTNIKTVWTKLTSQIRVTKSLLTKSMSKVSMS